MPSSQSISVQQTIFKAHYAPVAIYYCHESQIERHFPRFIQTLGDGVVGLAATFGAKGVLTTLAISSPTNVLVVTMTKSQTLPKGKHKKPDLAYEHLQKFLFDA